MLGRIRCRSIVGSVLAAALLGIAHLCVMPAHADIVSGPPDKPHGDSWRIETGEGVRTALVIPAVSPRAPTVIVLHGAVNSAGWAMRRFGFAEAAAARGLAAAFPQAVGSHWNDGRRSDRADDVAFLRRLAAELVERGVATPKRIYIAGISGGGMMALRMVCESADLIAGAGTVIASMPT
ncbi:MAG TPA: alpha/beta fold hydrolase, partial [Hyphomicrobiaceae bacterium]|nr:alpha/beta fold hydrolase [Hyphomicrobiaceae bacterium]